MNLALHQARINRSFTLSRTTPISLRNLANNTAFPSKGIYKWRVSYTIENDVPPEYSLVEYSEKPIHSLQVVAIQPSEYKYKSEDRAVLDMAYAQRASCDDVLIVINDRLTDTWYCNIALYNGKNWHTPLHCLLQGTMRQKLIENGKIIEKDILLSDLKQYKKVRLFNAMIPWSSKKDITIDHISISL